jgi:hypothetical protein
MRVAVASVALVLLVGTASAASTEAIVFSSDLAGNAHIYATGTASST